MLVMKYVLPEEREREREREYCTDRDNGTFFLGRFVAPRELTL